MIPLDTPLRRYPRGDDPRNDPAGWMKFARSFDDLAEDLVYARDVLDRMPENIWAMMIIVLQAQTKAEGRALTREMVRIGLKQWEPALSGREPAPAWGTELSCHPFMTAIIWHAEDLLEEGLRDEATQCLAFILKLDPEDRHGVVESMAEGGLIITQPSSAYAT